MMTQTELEARLLAVETALKEIQHRLAALPPAPLEEAEGLEQLRALHHGFRIRVVSVEGGATVAVDTPADLERVRTLMTPTTQEGRI